MRDAPPPPPPPPITPLNCSSRFSLSSHAVVRAACWSLERATLSLVCSTRIAKDPRSARRVAAEHTRAINRRCALERHGCGRRRHRSEVLRRCRDKASTGEDRPSSPRFRTSPRIRCSSVSVFSLSCSIAGASGCAGGVPAHIHLRASQCGSPHFLRKDDVFQQLPQSLVRLRHGIAALRHVSQGRPAGRSSSHSSVKVPAYSSRRRLCREALRAKGVT